MEAEYPKYHNGILESKVLRNMKPLMLIYECTSAVRTQLHYHIILIELGQY